MQQFFQSSPLASGSHTLVITSTVNDGYLFLDYIQFTPSSNASPTTLTKTTTIPVSPGQTPSASASASTTSVTPTTSSQITTIAQGTSMIITQGSDTLSTPSQSSNSTISHSSNSTLSQPSSFSVPATSAASSTRSSKAAPVGAIVGGVIAAAALVVIAVIALCLIRRSRRTRQGSQDSMTPFQNTAQGGSGSDNVIRNVGQRNKTLTNLHGPGSIPISPGLQSTLTTSENPRYPQNQEVASGTDVDSPPEYDYGESTRR